MARRVRSIFISYRRQDSAGYTLALARELRNRFGPSCVFLDVQQIGGGDDFFEALEREVSRCDALLAVIGPGWLTARAPDGRRRIDDAQDWVAVEVGTALARNIVIVPVLVDGAAMPSPEALPVTLSRLARRNAVVLRHERWDDDVENLVRTLEESDVRPRDAPAEPVMPGPAVEEVQAVTVLVVQLHYEAGTSDVDAFCGECAAVVARVVKPYGGVVQRRSPRELRVSFGLPQAHEDDAERAALSALKIRAQIRDLDAALGGSGVGVRIGIHTGRATLRPEPDADSVESVFQQAGDFANAVSLDTIALGRAAAARLSRQFELQPVEPTVPGGSVGVWQLHGARTGPDRLTPLVGRREEVSLLRRCLDNLREGRGYILGLIGEAGLGKTRLIEELRGVAGEGVAWLGGRCPSYGAIIPYLPVRQALRRYLGVGEADTDAAVRLRMRSRIGSLVGERFEELRPYLAVLLDVHPEPDDEEKFRYFAERPEDLADQINRAYGVFVEAQAARQPVVMAIEDLQWADSATRALLEALLPLTETCALLLVADFRPEKDSEAWKLRETVQRDYYPRWAEERVLRPLSDGEAKELVDSFLGGDQFDERVVTAVIKRAGGNPLYLEQLLSTLLDSAGIEGLPMEGGAVTDLPPAIEDLLVARIDRLPSTVQYVVQVGAVIGRTFSRRVLERVVELDGLIDAALDSALTTLKTADVLRERQFPEREYAFNQNMVQEAAASMLTPSRRRRIHAHVAQTMTELFADNLDDQAEALAHHFGEAGDHVKALVFGERAGTRAARLYANEEARRWWEHARSLASRLGDADGWRRLTHALADLHVRTGDFAAAVAHYRQLAQAVTDRDAAARLLAEAAWAVLDADDFAECNALLDETAGTATSTATQAAVELTRIRAAWFQDRIDDMGAGLEALEKIAAGGLPPDLDIKRMRMWDTYLGAVEDYDGAAAWDERLVALAQALGDPLQLVNAQRYLAITRMGTGNTAAGKDLLSEAYQLAEQVGSSSELIKVGCNLLYAHYLVGTLAEGMELGPRLLSRVRSDRWRIMILLNLGTLELEAGHTAAAAEWFSEGLELAERFGHPSLVAEAKTGLGTVRAMEGDGGRDALRAILPGTDSFVRLQALRFLAELALHTGQSDEAEQEARAGLEEKGQEAEKVALWRLLGLAQEARQPGTGCQTLEQALARARSAGRRLEEARCLAALARAGYSADPDAALVLAREMFEFCGADRDLAGLETTPN